MSNERRESSEINQAVEREIAQAQRLTEVPGVVETAGHELLEVMLERIAQHRKWGEQNHPNAVDLATVQAFGPPRDTDAAAQTVLRSYGIPSSDEARAMCNGAAKGGHVTWLHILLEEVCEAADVAAVADFADFAPTRRERLEELRVELLQVAAVAVAWAEAVNRQSSKLALAPTNRSLHDSASEP